MVIKMIEMYILPEDGVAPTSTYKLKILRGKLRFE